MGNVLKMEKLNQIYALLELKWSYREIERRTGVRRETISRYAKKKQNESKVPTGDLKAAKKCPPEKCHSNAAIYSSVIHESLQKGLSAQRIYQDLKVQGASVSYDSIKRYIRKLKTRQPKVYAVIHKAPGQEAQVDFGQGAPTLKGGKYKKPWLFKMVLSHCRHSYQEVVWKQDCETFLRCHEHAFEFFGGVVQTVVLDNLKSGVLDAFIYDPILNPLYQSFCEHWGFISLPCYPRRPEHKGKVESGVNYTQDNALKGRKFESLEQQNAFLVNWNKNQAMTRIHGTTKRQVKAMFEEEKRFLKPLKEPFKYFKISSRTVHADSHVEVQKAYYSVPFIYVGRQVIVHYNNEYVKILFKNQVIAMHRSARPGRFTTTSEHLPQHKYYNEAAYARYLTGKCKQIGSECEKWSRYALKNRQQRAYRPIQGVFNLTKKYGSHAVNQACGKALQVQSVRYHTLKEFCEEAKEEELSGQSLIQEHELIRGVDEYEKTLKLF